MKKIVIFTILLSLLVMPTSFAKKKTDGDKLKELGLMQGVEGNLYEEKELTRAELAILVLRLKGMEAEAETFMEDQNFTDVHESDWFYSYVSFVKSKALMQGVGDGKFEPEGIVSEEMVATVLMRSLGHNPNWGSARSEMAKMGIKPSVKNGDKIIRGEVFTYMYSALKQKIKGKEISLADELKVVLMDDEPEVVSEPESEHVMDPLLSKLFYQVKNDEDKVVAFKDLEGNTVKLEDLKMHANYDKWTSNMFVYEDKKSYLYNPLGEKVLEDPIDKKIRNNETNETLLMMGNKWFRCDAAYNVIAEGTLILDENEKIHSFSKDYFVIQKGDLGYYTKATTNPLETGELSSRRITLVKDHYAIIYSTNPMGENYSSDGGLVDLKTNEAIVGSDVAVMVSYIGRDDFNVSTSYGERYMVNLSDPKKAIFGEKYYISHLTFNLDAPLGIGSAKGLKTSGNYFDIEPMNLKGLVNREMVFVVEPSYNKIVFDSESEQFYAYNDDHTDVYSKEGALLVSLDYVIKSKFSDTKYTYEVEGKLGIVDTRTSSASGSLFEMAYVYNDHKFTIVMNDKVKSYYNSLGEKMVLEEGVQLRGYDDSHYTAYSADLSMVWIIDLQGNRVTEKIATPSRNLLINN